MPCPSSIPPTEALPSETLYVADKELRVVYTNDEWRQFAAANRGQPILGEGWNTCVLDNFSGRERARWESIYKMLLDGRLPFHEESFLCSSPIEKRVYGLRVTPQENEEGEIAWLVHRTVRLDADPAATDLSQRIHQLDEKPDVLAEEYRRRILGRDIHIEGFHTARHFEPLDSMGGDLLWDRQHERGGTDLVIADVVGHGHEAARLATKIVLMLDEIVSMDNEVQEILAKLNRAILQSTPEGDILFATGLFLRLDVERKRVLFHSFGHEPPIFSRCGLIHLENGPPVGMVDDPDPWPENVVGLDEHGDRFLIFSDGVTEQFNIDGEMWGAHGLEKEFRRLLDQPLHRMLQQVISHLRAFRGEALVKDDQTLLAMECIRGSVGG